MSLSVITILNDVIERVTAGQGVEDLSIQLDGASENWNKSLLCFAQLLVETGKVKNEVGIYRKCAQYYNPDELIVNHHIFHLQV